MKIRITRAISVAILTVATGWTSSAQNYQCQNIGGCSASIDTGGVSKVVSFRKGDLIDTDSGWVINPKEGWSKVMEIDRGDAGAQH